MVGDMNKSPEQDTGSIEMEVVDEGQMIVESSVDNDTNKPAEIVNEAEENNENESVKIADVTSTTEDVEDTDDVEIIEQEVPTIEIFDDENIIIEKDIKKDITEPTQTNKANDEIEQIDLCDSGDEQPLNNKPLIKVINFQGVDGSQGAKEEGDTTKSSEIIIGAEKDNETVLTECSSPPAENNATNEELEAYQVECHTISPSLQDCLQCAKRLSCLFMVIISGRNCYICSDDCLKDYRKTEKSSKQQMIDGLASSNADLDTVKKTCKVCSKTDCTLDWEAMDFCDENCLEAEFTKQFGIKCYHCDGIIPPLALTKYAVRFGNEIMQFCKTACLDDYKSKMKTCRYCQTNTCITESTSRKSNLRDFCSNKCRENFAQVTDIIKNKLSVAECAVCAKLKIVIVEVLGKDKIVQLCSDLCMSAYKFVNKISISFCMQCKKYFDKDYLREVVIYQDNQPQRFCSKICMNVNLIYNRKITSCEMCKAKKYSFDMINKKKVIPSKDANILPTSIHQHFCSLNCLALHALNVESKMNNGPQKRKCANCLITDLCLYQLNMSDNSNRNFCSYNCVQEFSRKTKGNVIHVVNPKIDVINRVSVRNSEHTSYNLRKLPTPTYAQDIQDIQDIQPQNSKQVIQTQNSTPVIQTHKSTPVIQTQKSAQVIQIQKPAHVVQSQNSSQSVQPQNPPQVANLIKVSTTPSLVAKNKTKLVANHDVLKNILVKPYELPDFANKMVQTRSILLSKSVSCKPNLNRRGTQTDVLPKGDSDDISDSNKVLIPVPVPIYVPCPMAMYSIPVPTLLPVPIPVPIPIFIPTTKNNAKEIMDDIKKIQENFPSDPFEAEILMMAEMVAGDKKDDADQSSPEAPQAPESESFIEDEVMESSSTFGEDMFQMALKMASDLESTQDLDTSLEEGERSKKRANDSPDVASKKRRIEDNEKPDSKMALKFTLGVNAWKHFARNWNKEVDMGKDGKKVKQELLEMGPEELNASLSLFLKEAKMANGSNYLPDIKFYLTLGIQYYLFESQRIDNIFFDPSFGTFTDILEEESQRFLTLYPEPKLVFTRIEEEHLWESKHLGACSPHSLLTALIYFNTKNFFLTTVEEHMQLSFTQLSNVCKRSSNASPDSHSNSPTFDSKHCLRFSPCQSALDSNPKRRSLYEQFDNKVDPFRCPVKLYNFYLNKCPESAKYRNDVFYLQPEQSGVGESPVWYSTRPLPKESLEKILNRLKMTKDLNQSLQSFI